jgi:hypothetical protein
MAEYVADGMAIAGTVEAVDLDNREVKAGNTRRSQVPLVTLHCGDRPAFPLSTQLWWANPNLVLAELRQVTASTVGWTVVLALLAGHNYGTRVPAEGAQVVYATLSRTTYPQPGSSGDIPWTHQPAAAGGGP